MTPNLLTLALVSLIPFLFAYIWFHPAVFGGEKWYTMADMPQGKRSAIKPFKLLLSLLLNFFIAFGLAQLVLHQMGVFSLVGGDAEILKTGSAAVFLKEYGHRHLSAGHGLFHGILTAILFAVPMLGYVTIFEKKSASYFLVYVAYWMISLGLMGMFISMYGGVAVV